MYSPGAIGRRSALGIALGIATLLFCATTGRADDPPVDEATPIAAPAESETTLPVEYEPLSPLFPRTWQVTPWLTTRLRGRVDTDAISTSQSAADFATFGDFGSTVGLRRARIGLEGNVGDNGRYVTEIDLASGQVVPQDIYLGLGDVAAEGERRGGHFREPFSLEGGTSANSFAFLERSPINMLDPARNWGLGFFQARDDHGRTLAFGMFHQGTGASDIPSGPGSTFGFTERMTLVPIFADQGRRLLHFGIALSERIPEHGVVIINQQPQTPLLNFGNSSASPFVPQIAIPSHYQQLFNLQLALARGSFWSQAEWYGTVISQIHGGTIFYHGCHADCGLFLTGEHREYLRDSGVFGAVKVNRPLLRGHASCDRPHGWGAWELTARFAYLDFVDPNTPLGPAGQLQGVRLPAATFGTNWYLADRIRLMFNYTYNVPFEQNTGSSVANTFATRLAVFW